MTCVISAGGKNFSVTPELALTCLGTFNGFADAATSAAGAAASRLLPALSFFLDPTTVGAPVDKTQTLPDGTRIHVTGQQDELARHVLVTLPNGQQTELVLTTGDNKHYNLIAGMVLGAQMPPSMLAEMAATLSSGNLNVVYSQKAGMGHNGGPPLDEDSPNGNNGDPNGKPPLGPNAAGFVTWRARQSYEDAPYHSSGNPTKSAKPSNPGEAFDHSYSIGENTSRRVGIDRQTGEFVVFDQTGTASTMWHGHVRAWGELSQQMQNALRSAGVMSGKGKIR